MVVEPAGRGPDLLALALSEPARALRAAELLLRSSPDPLSASQAHQAAGVVLRDRGDLRAARTSLRAALRAARASGDVDQVADVRATIGATEAMAGHPRRGLVLLDEAAATSRGLLLARIRLRRSYVLRELGRHEEAVGDLRAALAVARSHEDRLWEARILSHRAQAWMTLGDLRRADADAAVAERLFDAVGQSLESVDAAHNRATIAARRGDIPAALRRYDEAERRYRALEVDEPELVVHRGQALLAAGLSPEALLAVDHALEHGRAHALQRSELLLFGAEVALAAGEPALARDRADRAYVRLRAQHRLAWAMRAKAVSCQARYAAGERGRQLLTTATRTAEQLRATDADQPALAWLLVARLAADLRRPAEARAALDRVAAYRWTGSALVRATGWLGAAMRADADGDRRALRWACGRGLDALAEHRAVFGAAELRAHASAHASDLAVLAVDAATDSGSPRAMLDWSERSRGVSLLVSLAEPSLRPDAEVGRELAVVRDAARRLEEAVRDGASTTAARADRDRAETAVRVRRRQLAAAGGAPDRFDVDAFVAGLGEVTVLSLVESRGVLHVVRAGGGRVRRIPVGPIADAERELGFVLFALRRAAAGRPAADLGAQRLQEAVLGGAAGGLGDGPVVLVPTTRFHALPWGLLPVLADREVAAAPSLRAWQRAAAAGRSRGHVLLVGGPDLGSRGSEVAALAARHTSPYVLGRAAGAEPATVAAVVDRMDGARLAHVAAHGTFRADSPLFSALHLDDGALFVHDLERLRRPPRQVVLASCESGVAAPVGTQEMLGLVSGLLRIGTAGVLASVVPVHDDASVGVMSAVHDVLAGGAGLARAALAGRRAASGDALASATAASYGVWGC